MFAKGERRGSVAVGTASREARRCAADAAEMSSRGSIFPATRASGGMADALASGASVRKDVGVQVPPRPPDGD